MNVASISYGFPSYLPIPNVPVEFLNTQKANHMPPSSLDSENIAERLPRSIRYPQLCNYQCFEENSKTALEHWAVGHSQEPCYLGLTSVDKRRTQDINQNSNIYTSIIVDYCSIALFLTISYIVYNIIIGWPFSADNFDITC
jgi:hypothetical protein